MSILKINSCANLCGEVSIPGDKSISHRALMFASLAMGTSTIKNLLTGHDCIATLQLMRDLGIKIEQKDTVFLVHGEGRFGLKEPQNVLNAQNSGTTIRLMAGLLASMDFFCTLSGSEQIRRRPMGRVIEPLKLMGANIFGRKNNSLAPLAIYKSTLKNSTYKLKQKSAQVKSALMLAGLFAQGIKITNTKLTRDHTERMLEFMGAQINTGEDFVEVKPLKNELKPLEITIPGDISSAAFLIVAAVFLSKEGVRLKNVGVNHTRIGIINALMKMGADIKLENVHMHAKEEVADIFVKKSILQGATFSGDEIVTMIDEIPILALAAAKAHGQTIIKDASELKVKESNRIATTVLELSKIGACLKETADGMIITGISSLKGGKTQSHQDHRIALMLCVGGLLSEQGCEINGWEVIDDSFPGFLATIKKLGGSFSEVEL